MITLTIWTTLFFSPTHTITSGQILADEVAVFEATHPRVRLHFVLKEPYGKGGLLDFLSTAGAVVPTLLPDLLILDVDELESAAQNNWVQPLEDLIPADLQADLYPFARDGSSLGGRLYGLQFQADLEHVLYNTARISVAPRSWPDVLGLEAPYLFPAGGEAGLVNDAFLIQYLAAWEQAASDPTATPFLEVDTLTTVFQFYLDALSSGAVLAEIGEHHSTDDCWNAYLAGRTGMAQISAHRYLLERRRLENAAVAAIPGIDGPAAPIARGWALALVTADPARQAAAVDWMVQLMSPTTNAAWNQAAHYLPTRVAAMAEWNIDDSYHRFIERQLLQAQPRPALPRYTQAAAALQEAVSAVISGALTPREAAVQVVTESQ